MEGQNVTNKWLDADVVEDDRRCERPSYTMVEKIYLALSATVKVPV